MNDMLSESFSLNENSNLQRVSEYDSNAQCDARQLDNVQVRREIFRDNLIDVAPVAEISGNPERTQNDSDEKNGRVEENAKPMPITLGN